ncbi:MAG: aromatic ring-hydroxylating dioxygenase subunit alpha [Myxococcota bacterium]
MSIESSVPFGANRGRPSLPPYPNSWYRVAFSHEVPRGTVKSVSAFGRDLVVFRGEDGELGVLDAYCPHLGAHLGHNGRVENNAVVCPFHAWSFDKGGECTKIAYCDKIPKRARAEAFEVDERNGMVFVYHHDRGQAPAARVPEIPELSDPDWLPYRSITVPVRAHVQDMGENAVDAPHFQVVHGTKDVPDIARVEVSDDRFVTRLVDHFDFFGKSRPVDIEISIYQPGFTTVRIGLFMKVLIVTTTTAVSEDLTTQTHSIVVRRGRVPLLARLFRWFFMREIRRQLEQDRQVLDYKRYNEVPVLCAEDGPVMKYRRWFSRFYSDQTRASRRRLDVVG